LTDCYYEKKDWRACKKEMEIFRKCWKIHGNEKRTDTKDV
jgi:cytochrome c oxidase assembly factor 4